MVWGLKVRSRVVNTLYMIRQNIRLTLPNPHKSDIGVGLLKRILHQADITEDEWNKTL